MERFCKVQYWKAGSTCVLSLGLWSLMGFESFESSLRDILTSSLLMVPPFFKLSECRNKAKKRPYIEAIVDVGWGCRLIYYWNEAKIDWESCESRQIWFTIEEKFSVEVDSPPLQPSKTVKCIWLFYLSKSKGLKGMKLLWSYLHATNFGSKTTTRIYLGKVAGFIY